MDYKPKLIGPNIWMVPCIDRPDSNEYEPLYMPFCNEINAKKLQVRQTWLPVEDDTLRKIVSQKKTQNWSLRAKELNEIVHKGLPMRQAKQCRERWLNKLNPDLNKEKWNDSEDLVILERQSGIGNKWGEIANLLNGRTENQVKNRFKSLMRKGKRLGDNEKERVERLIQQIREGGNEESGNFEMPQEIKRMPYFSYSEVYNQQQTDDIFPSLL